jgi:hypothetical protein
MPNKPCDRPTCPGYGFYSCPWHQSDVESESRVVETNLVEGQVAEFKLLDLQTDQIECGVITLMDDNRLDEPIARFEKNTNCVLSEYECSIAAWFFYEGVQQTAGEAVRQLTKLTRKGDSTDV